MGQITEAFCKQMLAHCDRGEHPPLTVWEAKQLALAWLQLEDARKLAVHLSSGGIDPDKKIYSKRDVEALIAVTRAVELMAEQRRAHS